MGSHSGNRVGTDGKGSHSGNRVNTDGKGSHSGNRLGTVGKGSAQVAEAPIGSLAQPILLLRCNVHAEISLECLPVYITHHAHNCTQQNCNLFDSPIAHLVLSIYVLVLILLMRD